MNSKITLASNALWLAHPFLLGMVAAVMVWRKQRRTFPVFFWYLICQIVMGPIVYAFHRFGTYEEYFYAYWISAAISLPLGFKVIHEIFLDVFRPYHTLKDLGSVLFKWAGLVMLLVACVVAAASPYTDQGALVQSVLTVQRCVRVVQVGLVLFLLVFSRYLGVSWRQQSFGIALGFGGFALIELGLVAFAATGHVNETVSTLINTSVYNLSILVWFGYAWRKSQAREPSLSLLASQRWDQSFSDLQRPAAEDSLIPMFEGMVERALSRNNGDPNESIPATRVSSGQKPESEKKDLPEKARGAASSKS